MHNFKIDLPSYRIVICFSTILWMVYIDIVNPWPKAWGSWHLCKFIPCGRRHSSKNKFPKTCRPNDSDLIPYDRLWIFDVVCGVMHSIKSMLMNINHFATFLPPQWISLHRCYKSLAFTRKHLQRVHAIQVIKLKVKILGGHLIIILACLTMESMSYTQN